MGARTPVPSFDEVKDALRRLDGTACSALTLITGLTPEEIDAVGGLPSDSAAA
jgi:hypothetical protein